MGLTDENCTILRLKPPSLNPRIHFMQAQVLPLLFLVGVIQIGRYRKNGNPLQPMSFFRVPLPLMQPDKK